MLPVLTVRGDPRVDYLAYYYESGTEPFRSLSALSDTDATRIMERLYVAHRGNLLFERFEDPAGYLHSRRQAERWVRAGFIARGGRPQAAFPISMVLGSSRWIEEHAPDPRAHAELRIPLSVFQEADVSFTYPDSMVSYWLYREKPPAYYRPEYHGMIFTIPEILELVERDGLPEGWTMPLPSHVGPYVEAQVWNHQPLAAYRGDCRPG